MLIPGSCVLEQYPYKSYYLVLLPINDDSFQTKVQFRLTQFSFSFPLFLDQISTLVRHSTCLSSKWFLG